MKPFPRSLLLALGLSLLDGCATATAPAETVQRPRRRRRRAAAPVTATTAPTTATTTVTAPDTPATPEGLSLVPTVRRVGAGSEEGRPNAQSMGSPVVQAPVAEGRPMTARWVGPRSSHRIACEGEGSPQRASMQSAYDPTNAMIVRAMLPAEPAVLACRPPVNREGRIPVRVLFAGNGLPIEVRLSADVTQPQGLCLGAALCNVRLAAFRAPNATVSYAFVAAVAAPTEDPPTDE